MVAVPEGSTRKAMMSTGELDIADLDLRDTIPLLKAGFGQSSGQRQSGVTLHLAGNYWEEKHAQTGEVYAHPTMIHDLPLGGRRLVQDATGYVATIKNGQVVSENGKANGVLPGKLIRGKQVCEVKTGISEVSLFDKTIRLLAVKVLSFIWRLTGKSMKTTIVSET